MTRETGNILISNVRIVDANGAGAPVDIRIEQGIITEIGSDLTPGDELAISGEGKFVSAGWMDMHVHLREPGFEYKETIKTGCDAAAFGGFTAVACMPNTEPPIHTRDVVEFIIDRARSTPVDVYPIACVSKERAGEELAEMADLKAGGAVAFSDDGSPVQNAGLMRRALEYASMLDCPVINHMEDLELNPDGQMHEGEFRFTRAE
jgi:dihydroorotase